MKKITIAFLLLGALAVQAQDVQKDSVVETLKEVVGQHSMKFTSLDEKLSGMEAVLNAISNIKITGYAQAQYEMYDNWSADGTKHGSGTPLVTNTFFIRRARVKFTYKATDGVKFVLCPDYSIDKVNIKDAYVQLNDRWINTFSLWMGQFNRPTYEVEYSSATREFAERSLMTRTLYPTERETGAKLEADFLTKYNVPLRLQLAVLNGNFGAGSTTNQTKDVDNSKDVMARAVYSFSSPSTGLAVDFGGHGYFGSSTVISQTSIPTIFSDVNGNAFTPVVGDKLKKQWLGGEMQVYYDFFGGMSLKCEYIKGTNTGFSSTEFASQSVSLFNANKVRNIEGYYIAMIKNIGKSHEFSVRYDVFDPNTKFSGDQVAKKDDLKYKIWTFAYQYFFDENVKIMFCYNMPINEKSANTGLVGTDFANRDKKDNTFTLRLQASF